MDQSFVLVLTLLVLLGRGSEVYGQSLTPGVQGRSSFEIGQRQFNEGLYEEAVEALEQALIRGLDESQTVQAYLLLALADFSLNRIESTRRRFQQLLVHRPLFTLPASEFPPDVVGLLNDIKARNPIIFDIKIAPYRFYPYGTQRPSLQFYISAPDVVTITFITPQLTGALRSSIRDAERIDVQNTSDPHNVYWRWQDGFLTQGVLNVELRPTRNAEFGTQRKRIRLDMSLPAGLSFDGRFNLAGRELLPEARYSKGTSPVWCTVGVLGGLFLGTRLEKVTPPDNRKWAYIVGVGAGVTFGCLPQIESRRPIPENIERNRVLNEDIETAKRQIVVIQILEDAQ